MLPMIIIFIVFGLFTTFVTRGYIDGVICDSLSPSARKKRKKGQSFKEWFLFSRYSDLIPRFMMVGYLATLISLLPLTAALIVLHLLKLNDEVIRIIFFAMIVLISIYPLINTYRFRTPRKGSGWNYRTVVKKNSNKNSGRKK